MNPLISEFSYGYAVTDELIHGLGTPITAAPVFPSLYQEGQTGGGYDVMLQRPTIPLFIQFKLAHCLTKRNAAEASLLSLPYYRMHVRPSRHSNQHALLLALEAQGNDVYYCAPAFHEGHELNDAYLTQNVCNRSIWLLPSCIGPLPDDNSHYVAFQHANVTDFYFCSKPQQIYTDITFSAFVKRTYSRLIDTGKTAENVDPFASLINSMRDTAARLQLFSTDIPDKGRFADLRPIEQAAVLANVLYDSQLYVATLNDSA